MSRWLTMNAAHVLERGGGGGAWRGNHDCVTSSPAPGVVGRESPGVRTLGWLCVLAGGSKFGTSTEEGASDSVAGVNVASSDLGVVVMGISSVS